MTLEELKEKNIENTLKEYNEWGQLKYMCMTSYSPEEGQGAAKKELEERLFEVTSKFIKYDTYKNFELGK